MTTKIPSSMLRNALPLGSSASANRNAWQSAFDKGGAYTTDCPFTFQVARLA